MEITEKGHVLWIYKDKPPLKVRNLAARVAERHPEMSFVIRWLRCGRGCAHGRAYGYLPEETRMALARQGRREVYSYRSRYIRLYYGVHESDNLIVTLHEMAHHLRGTSFWHDDGFYRELLTEAKAEGMLRPVVNYQGRNAKRVLREMRAKERAAA